MELEEAIKHAEESANTNERLCKTVHPAMQLSDYGKCAEEHRQLAEWLRELKLARECIGHIRIACFTLKGDSFKNDVVKTMTKYFYDIGKESEALSMQYQYLSRSQKSQYDDTELAKRILNTIDEYIRDKKKE